MPQETLFSITNALALFSWIYLVIFPFRPSTNKILIGVSVTLLAIAYTWLVFQSLSLSDFEKFKTLEGITGLFSVPGAVLVGWIHYLAFDLMVGLFIAHNAAKHGIRHIIIIPCLMFTFLLGPVGLLLFLVIRWSFTKQLFADNF